MSDPGSTEIRCPWCREEIRVEPLRVVTFTAPEEARERLLSGEYDTFPCPACTREVPWSNPVVARDLAREVLIYYFPDPPLGEIRDSIEADLMNPPVDLDLGFEGVPATPGSDWTIRVVFGRDELRAPIENRLEGEGGP